MIYGGVALTAAAAGAGFATWRAGRADVAQAPAAPDQETAGQAFWRMSFDTPSGSTLAVASLQGKPLLVNFWATWCPPCIEELPLLDYFYQENKAKKWQVLGLAVDQPSAVRAWLQSRPLNFPVAMAGLNGTELSKMLGNSAGSLPFTVVFDAKGAIVHRKVGKVEPEELARWTALQ